MGLIYKVTNILNNDKYIGKTTVPLKERWKGHLNRAKSDPKRNEHFINAIRKYGEDNFVIELIEECPDDLLNEREKYWIAKYNTFHGPGYNSTEGGEGTEKYSREEMLQLWNEGENVGKIAEEMGCQITTVSNGLKNKGISEEEILNRGYAITGEKISRGVEQYSLDGKLIKKYNKLEDAANETHIDRGTIINACKRIVFGRNYYWKYADDEEPIEDKIQRANKKFSTYKRPIEQYSLQGEFIAEYNSLTEAARKTNGNQQSICLAAQHKTLTSGNCLWRYKNDPNDIEFYVEEYNKKMKTKGTKSVNQYDDENNFVARFDSMKEAAQAIGVNPSTISYAVSNHKKTKGYYFILA